MAISKDQLGSDESVILEMRTHGKALIVPVISLFALASVIGAGIALFPPEWKPWANYAAAGVALIVFIWLVLLPFLRWLTSTYTITDRRIITRKGIINKVGHDLPLRRINNVNYERSLTDRMLGCGTLILETAAEQPLVLPDLPKIEQVHVQIADILFGDMNNESSIHDD